ncbi:MAG: type II CAAX endopeptidase family protein [Chthoniobacteraceae bacterium]
MLFAAIPNEIKLSAGQALLANAVGLCLLYCGIFVCRKMIRRVAHRGGLVRSDLLGMPDMLVAGTLAALLLLLVAMQWLAPAASKPPSVPDAPAHAVTGLQIIYGALQFALPVGAVLALLIARGVSLVTLFGVKRVSPLRAIGIAAGLVLLLLPLFMIVTVIAYQFIGEHAEQQELVKVYQQAAKTGNREIIWQVMVAAVVIAPITEEILFRGYFYPVLKRIAGPLPAAAGISLLFGAIHNNALGMPGLTLLALGLTLAYEWSGSILVPMFMHAWFNGTTLFAMWWASRHGMAL